MSDPTAPTEGPRAKAYIVLDALVRPQSQWDGALKARLPPTIKAMYEPPPPGSVTEKSLTRLRTRLGLGLRTRGYVLSQKGSGKSMALLLLAEEFGSSHQVLFISLWRPMGGGEGATIHDLLLVIAAALAVRARDGAFARIDDALYRQVHAFAQSLAEVVPMPVDGDHALGPWATYLESAAQSLPISAGLRAKLREHAPGTFLVPVINYLLGMCQPPGESRRFLLILDDGDKIRGDIAPEIFLRHEQVLAEVEADMLVTVPFSLRSSPGFGGLASHEVYEIRNVPVVHQARPDEVLSEGVEWFRRMLDRLLEQRSQSVFPDAILARTALLSAGIPIELGKLLQAAVVDGGLDGEHPVTEAEVDEAVRHVRRPLEAATHNADTRLRLAAVHASQRLEEEADYHLVDANMVVAYGNTTVDLWYDVHPLLVKVVKGWKP